mmetsp:Transcript_89043/g.154425  ORF Transcript_89043/g.154425 Transcript_89043/m.154425 type:complete len:476 (-) Transcript_89043:2158-3585(-)
MTLQTRMQGDDRPHVGDAVVAELCNLGGAQGRRQEPQHHPVENGFLVESPVLPVHGDLQPLAHVLHYLHAVPLRLCGQKALQESDANVVVHLHAFDGHFAGGDQRVAPGIQPGLRHEQFRVQTAQFVVGAGEGLTVDRAWPPCKAGDSAQAHLLVPVDPQGREPALGQHGVGLRHLEDMQGVLQAFEVVRPHIREDDVRVFPLEAVVDVAGDQHLPSMSQALQAGGGVHHRAVVVVALADLVMHDLAMAAVAHDPDPHATAGAVLAGGRAHELHGGQGQVQIVGAGLGPGAAHGGVGVLKDVCLPIVLVEHQLHTESKLHRPLRGRSGTHERIADGLDLIQAVFRDELAHHFVVHFEGTGHLRRKEAPQVGTGLNVGEDDAERLGPGLGGRGVAAPGAVHEQQHQQAPQQAQYPRSDNEVRDQLTLHLHVTVEPTPPWKAGTVAELAGSLAMAIVGAHGGVVHPQAPMDVHHRHL